MAGNAESKEEGGFFGNLFEKAALAVGAAEEVPDEIPMDESESLPVANTIPAPPQSSYATQVATASNAQAPDMTAKIEALYQSELNETLAQSNTALAKYLEQRNIMRDALSAGLSGEALENAATVAALKVTKLSATDINAAFDAFKMHRKQSRTDFDANCNERHKNEVEDPRHQTAQTEKEINSLEQQVAQLGIEIANKKASIGPVLEKAAQQEMKISNAKTAYQKAEAQVAEVLENMRKNLLGIVSK